MRWIWLAAWMAAPAAAQQAPQPAVQPRGGFSIGEASVFASYYSLGLPPYLIGSAAPSGDVGYDVAYGGSAVLNLTRPSERTTFTLQYTPSYTGRVRYTDWNAFSNALNIQVGHSVSSRLRFGLSAAGSIRNREEFLFSPIQTSALAAAPGSLQDLSQAMSGAGVPTGSPTSLVAGAPAGDAATQTLFFGSRILTATARAGLDYSITPRLSLGFGVSGSRTQYFRDRTRDQTSTAVLPQVSAVSGDLNLSYSLTPRTSITLMGTATRQQSRVQDVLISDGRVSVERTMGPHWFVNAYGGAGSFHVIRQVGPPSEPLQYLAGGGAGYRSNAHTFLASFDRRISDLYGVGATNTRGVNGSWRWAPPPGRTWISLGVSRTELQSIAFPAITWRATAGVGRSLGRGLAVFCEYSYLAYSNLALRGDDMLDQSAVRVGLSWIPHPQVTAPTGN